MQIYENFLRYQIFKINKWPRMHFRETDRPVRLAVLSFACDADVHLPPDVCLLLAARPFALRCRRLLVARRSLVARCSLFVCGLPFTCCPPFVARRAVCCLAASLFACGLPPACSLFAACRPSCGHSAIASGRAGVRWSRPRVSASCRTACIRRVWTSV